MGPWFTYAIFTQICGFGVGFGVLRPVSGMQLGLFLEALPMYYKKHTCILPHGLDPTYNGPMVYYSLIRHSAIEAVLRVRQQRYFQLSSGMLKNNIMETTFKLQEVDEFKHAIMTHDMTKSEREQCKS